MTKKTTTRKTKATTRKVNKKQETEVFLANGKIEQDHNLAKDIEDILNAPRNPFGVESLENLEERVSIYEY